MSEVAQRQDHVSFEIGGDLAEEPAEGWERYFATHVMRAIAQIGTPDVVVTKALNRGSYGAHIVVVFRRRK